ncbi:CHAT domain-containing protein [Massilia consociata]|uniref:CHAT domain-containing protein n=1 Tax=Massilia consociata TaxID=760117 RepID=A0ABV6FMM6_9BURK
MIYQNFDLEIIRPHGGDHLCARVLESPQGDCPFADVKWPFDAEEENERLTEIYGGLRQRGSRSSRANMIQDFGGKLFEAVFTGDIEHLFRSSLDASFRAGKGLRIRLRLPEDSELHVRPWEFLFDTESREFLAVREHTPLVRYLPVKQPTPPIMVEGPLRVLVALSSPRDHPRLDTTREWDILCDALEPSITAGRLELRQVPGRCTFDNLRDSLRHYGAHIFHFVGHGVPGKLVLEQESGKGQEMEATHLRAVFPGGALPRLIVLNACSGAIAQDVPFSGLAQGFLRQGVPAVVAMQASITDEAAVIFTRYFYRDLIEIGAVDTSLTEARLRMQANGYPIEWGTPVLYMRALSGQLFLPPANRLASPAPSPVEPDKPWEPPAPPPGMEPGLEGGERHGRSRKSGRSRARCRFRQRQARPERKRRGLPVPRRRSVCRPPGPGRAGTNGRSCRQHRRRRPHHPRHPCRRNRVRPGNPSRHPSRRWGLHRPPLRHRPRRTGSTVRWREQRHRP